MCIRDSHRHVEHVGDGLALEQHVQRLAVVALAVADVAGDVDVGQEAVSYTHLRAHETVLDLVCRLLLEKKKNSIVGDL